MSEKEFKGSSDLETAKSGVVIDEPIEAESNSSKEKSSKDKESKEKDPKDSSSASAAPPLSNKELKELKKKEKAAKRAAEKEKQGLPERSTQKKDKKKQVTSTNLKKKLNESIIKDENVKVPSLFSHLETREQRNASSPSIHHIVHPAVLKLTIKYSTYKIVGSVARLRSMLEAFKNVIQDYRTPEYQTLSRHLTGHLSHQIEYIKTARPLSISMGNAIRWLKQEISYISIDTNDDHAKDILCQKIDDFIKEKIELSEQVIIESASQQISNESTILTFGHSEVLEKLFKYCVTKQNKKFNLVIVDSRPLFEGKKLLNQLIDEVLPSGEEGKKFPITKTHIRVQYVVINSLASSILNDVDCVFLGAHAMLSNGRLYSRVGTGLIAMMCHQRNIPVLTCCESVKFSDKVQLDSVTTNELGDADDLADSGITKNPRQKNAFALEQFLRQTEEPKKVEKKGQQKKEEPKPIDPTADTPILHDWKKIPSLSILNVMYDLTPPEYINKVVTELGALPPSSVPVILREYKNT